MPEFNFGDIPDIESPSRAVSRPAFNFGDIPSAISYAPDRDFLTDAINTLGVGGLDAIQMVAKAFTASGIKDMRSVIKDVDRYKANATWDDPSRQYRENSLRRTVLDGVRSFASSTGARLGGLAAGAVVGAAGGPVGVVGGMAIGGAIAGAPVYGLAAYYDFAEDAKAAGIPESAFKDEAVMAAFAEGGLELASDLVFMRIFGFIGAKPGVKAFLKKPLTQKFFKGFLGKYLLTAGEEIPTEMAQEWAGIKLREKAGVPLDMTASEAMRGVIGPTAVSSALFALSGMGGQSIKKKIVKAKENARKRSVDIPSELESREVTMEDMQAVNDEVATPRVQSYEQMWGDKFSDIHKVRTSEEGRLEVLKSLEKMEIEGVLEEQQADEEALVGKMASGIESERKRRLYDDLLESGVVTEEDVHNIRGTARGKRYLMNQLAELDEQGQREAAELENILDQIREGDETFDSKQDELIAGLEKIGGVREDIMGEAEEAPVEAVAPAVEDAPIEPVAPQLDFGDIPGIKPTAIAKETKTKKPITDDFAKIVKANGGLKAEGDLSGDVRALPLFVRNQKGLTPDVMAEKLIEAGYPIESTADLLTKVRNRTEYVTEATFGTREQQEKEVMDRHGPEGPMWKETISAGNLEKGDQFKIDGEQFKVIKDEPGEIVLKDGVTKTLDEFDKIDVDRGEIEKGKVTTEKVEGAKHDQIVSPELLGQAKAPKGKIKARGPVSPIEGTQGVGMFKTETGEKQQDVFDEPAPTTKHSIAIKKKFDQVLPKLKGAAKTVVVDDVDGLPENIRKAAKEADGKTRGVYDPRTKTVYLVGSNLENTDQAISTFIHEQVGHHSTKEMLGGQYSAKMKEIQKAVGVDEVRRSIPKSYHSLSNERQTEEYIARLASKMSATGELTGQEKTIWDRFVQFIKQSIGLSTNKAAEDFVIKSYKYMLKGDDKITAQRETGKGLEFDIAESPKAPIEGSKFKKLKPFESIAKVVEPAKLVEKKHGAEVYSDVMEMVGKPTAETDRVRKMRGIDDVDTVIGTLEGTLDHEFTQKELDNYQVTRQQSKFEEGQAEYARAKSELPDGLKSGEFIQKVKRVTKQITDHTHRVLVDLQKKMLGDEAQLELFDSYLGYVEEYFYGRYKDTPALRERIHQAQKSARAHFTTTKRFMKSKAFDTYADARAAGLELKDANPITNALSELAAVEQLSANHDLKQKLFESGEDLYVQKSKDGKGVKEGWVQIGEDGDPVWDGVYAEPDLARLINNMLSTNKVVSSKPLNTLRRVNAVARALKFLGSVYHITMVEVKQAVADSGYLGFLNPKRFAQSMKHAAASSKAMIKKIDADPFTKKVYHEYVKLLGTPIGAKSGYELELQSIRTIEKFLSDKGLLKAKKTKAGKALFAIPGIPVKFVDWMFRNYVPTLKFAKYMQHVAIQEKKVGRELTKAEKLNIIKEGQNFYGEMNEKLFGRDSTTTSLLRLIFMAPGFAEGNYRTTIKSLVQWRGQNAAHRSRANIMNSLIITSVLATIGTMILKGKPPEPPEKMEDVRDLFKIDTGQVDAKGKKIMIDLLSYDKDYYEIFGKMLFGPRKEIPASVFKRLGGMKAPLVTLIRDSIALFEGRALVDWKGDRVFYHTDPFFTKLLKVANHITAEMEPIAWSTFKQSRQRSSNDISSFVESMAGVRKTYTEADRREMQAFRKLYDLREKREDRYRELSESKNPAKLVRSFNSEVLKMIRNKDIPANVKVQMRGLLINIEKYIGYNITRLTSDKTTPMQRRRIYKILTKFRVGPAQYGQYLSVYRKRGR